MRDAVVLTPRQWMVLRAAAAGRVLCPMRGRDAGCWFMAPEGRGQGAQPVSGTVVSLLRRGLLERAEPAGPRSPALAHATEAGRALLERKGDDDG